MNPQTGLLSIFARRTAQIVIGKTPGAEDIGKIAFFVQSKPVIRDLKGLADFVPYLGYPLLPTLIFSETSRQFHNVNNNFMNDKD